MIETLIAITKYSVLFAGNFYGYIRLSKIKFSLLNLIDLLFCVILATGLFYATKYFRLLIPIGLLILSFFYSLIRYRKPLLHTLIICSISCGFTVAVMIVAMPLSLPFDFIIFKTVSDETTRNLFTLGILCVLQIVLTFLIYKIKRFKSGISVNSKDGSVDILLLISILSLFLTTLFYIDNISKSPVELIAIAIIFCGLGLIFVWKKHIINNYQKQLYNRNEEIYEHRLEEFEKEREELLAQNAELAKIIHRDNKLIPAMVIAVKDVITETGNENLQELLFQLDYLSTEHKEAIDTYQAKSDRLPKTDVIAIDAVLHFLSSKALQNNIEFNVHIDKDSISNLLSRINDLTELTTIICDLGENAIIATKQIPDGKIMISFELTEFSVPSVLFYDNGEPFNEKVIANMGKRKITTHKADGGSGIGLMTLFEILNKHNASFLLDEQSNIEDFKKSVKITFDGLQKVTILKSS